MQNSLAESKYLLSQQFIANFLILRPLQEINKPPFTGSSTIVVAPSHFKLKVWIAHILLSKLHWSLHHIQGVCTVGSTKLRYQLALSENFTFFAAGAPIRVVRGGAYCPPLFQDNSNPATIAEYPLTYPKLFTN